MEKDDYDKALRENHPELFQEPPDSRLILTQGEQPLEMRGMNQLMETIDKAMPAVERITGLQRRDIFLQLLKSGFKGNMNGFLDGLIGKQPEKPSRFEKYVKTLCIWIPVAIGLLGLVIVGLIALIKLVDVML